MKSYLMIFFTFLVQLSSSSQDDTLVFCDKISNLFRSDTGQWIIFEGYFDKKGLIEKNDLDLYILKSSILNKDSFMISSKQVFSFITQYDTLLYQKCKNISLIERTEYNSFIKILKQTYPRDSLKIKRKLFTNFPNRSGSVYLRYIKFNATISYINLIQSSKTYHLYFYNSPQKGRFKYIEEEVPVKCIIHFELLPLLIPLTKSKN